MATYSADADQIDGVANELVAQANSLSGLASSIALIDTSPYSVWDATSEVGSVETWAVDWAASLRARATTLHHMKYATMGGPGSMALDPEYADWIYEGGSPLSFADWELQRLDAEISAYEEQVAELEAQIEALEAQTPSHYQGMALFFARQELRRLESERYRELERRIALETPGTAMFDDMRAHLRNVADDLGLEADGYAAAAHAMTEGLSPVQAGVDSLYFPADYAEASATSARLQAQLEELNDNRKNPRQPGFHDWRDARMAVVEEIEDLGFEPATQGEVVAWLDDLLPVTSAEQHRLVGEYLAAELHEAAGRDSELMKELSGLVDLHVNVPLEAVAMLNGMDPVILSALPQLGAPTGWDGDLYDFMLPFADALALASSSTALDIDLTAVVDDPNSAFWFLSDLRYDTDTLIEAGTALTTIDGHMWWNRNFYGPDGEEWVRDPRVHIFNAIAELPPNRAEDLLQSIVDHGDIVNFINPDNHLADYADNGNAAGLILALVGTGMDESSAVLIAEAMATIGEHGGQDGVIQGGGLMVAGHVGSFATGPDGESLPETPLREVLDGLGEPERSNVLRQYLEETMSDDVAAEHIFNAFSLTMAMAVAGEFDPTDTDGHANAFGDAGRLFDEIVSAYLDVNLADARNTDEWNALWQGVISTAIDLTAAVALIGTGGVGGFVAGALVSTGNNVGLPLFTDFGLPTDNAEGVLELGYELEASFVHQANLLLALHLHEAGVIELPAEWFAHDILKPVPIEVWEEFRLELEAIDFPFDAWFNDPTSLGGHVDWTPSGN